MSNNLNLDQVAENQANKEVTINTATGQLDAALTEVRSNDFTAGNISLTNLQYRAALKQLCTNVTVGGRTLTLPGIKKLTIFVSDAANTQTLDIVKGSATYTLAPGGVALLYTDGTTNSLEVIAESAAGAAKPYDVGTFCVGLPAASERLLIFNYVRNIELPIGLSGSRVTARVAATAQTDFDVTLNGSSIGTIRFAAAGTVATFVGFATVTTIAPNDKLGIDAPGSQDATLADIAFTIAGAQL